MSTDLRTKAPLDVRLARRLVLDEATGCLEWVGNRGARGYGVIRMGEAPYRSRYTHRVAWELAHGPVPEGLFVCHRCDNRICCNVEHLFVGSAADNSGDMVSKGRQAYGSAVHNAYLSDAEVAAMRALRDQGWTYERLAKRFGTSSRNVGSICRGESWRHVL